MASKIKYGDASNKKVDLQEAYKRTVARLQKIQSHLDNAPRGTRLKDKVCIITGVGSLKGIGYVLHCRVVIIRRVLIVLSRRN